MSTSIVSSPTMPSPIMPSTMIPTATMPTSITPTSTRSSPNGMLQQQIDAIFQEVDSVSLSLDANLSAKNPQLSGFLALLHSNLDALEATALHRLDALETTP